MAQVMTESQVPTDALASLRHLYSNLVNGGVRDTASAKRIAEGLLAPVIEDLERRTSAPVGVGEVAERYRNAIASACEGWTMPDGLRKHLETALWSQPTPQPTQPQAGAVPLTCEWTHNEDDGFWETACGEAWRFDDGGPGENNMHFCHSCGNSLRIKGGQHG